MLSKNNLKHILILGIGFFWCSGIYLTQQTYMLTLNDKSIVNIVALLYGSISMALGILLFIILYCKSKNIKLYYILFNLLAIICSFVFFSTTNKLVMSICLCLTCLFSTAGFGAGYHFSLIALNIEKAYRGRVFAIGYGMGSILTYLVSLLPTKIYGTISAMLIYIPIIILNIVLVYQNRDLNIISNEKYTKNYKKYFLIISLIVLLMSLLSAISTDVISTYIFNMKGLFANTRIYYCLGLIIAGYLMDKNKEIFEICTLTSFIFSLLSIVLLNQKISPSLIVALSYFFIGFFVVFRTIIFINLSDQKKGMIAICAIGLMYSRIMEGLFVIFQKYLIKNYTLLIVIEALILCIVLWVYILSYLKNSHTSMNDRVQDIVIKYNLTPQEEKILNLLIQDLTKKEIADKLYLSVNTIKIHVTNIYKKTGMKKNELKEKCKLRVN